MKLLTQWKLKKKISLWYFLCFAIICSILFYFYYQEKVLNEQISTFYPTLLNPKSLTLEEVTLFNQFPKRLQQKLILRAIEGFQHIDSQIRLSSIRVFLKIDKGAEQAIPALLEVLYKDKEGLVRSKAIFTLRKIGNKPKELFPHLIIALQDTHIEVRKAAINALGEMGAQAESATPFLIKALQDKEAQVREYAVKALGNMARQWNKGATFRNGVREYAVKALGNMGEKKLKQIIPPLIEVLKDKNEEVRRAAIITIGFSGEQAEQAIPTLSDLLLQDKDIHIRYSILRAFGRIGTVGKAEKTLPILIETLTDKDMYIRKATIETLEILGKKAEQAIPLLKELAETDPESEVRKSAKEALKKIE